MIYCLKLPILISHHFDFGEKKKDFPKELFNENCLIIGDYEYIYITEIEKKERKKKKKKPCMILGARQFLSTPPPKKKMLTLSN